MESVRFDPTVELITHFGISSLHQGRTSSIESQQEYYFDFYRVGNKGELQVQRQLPSADLVTEKKTAYASSNDQVAKMSLFNIEVYIGGFPGEV